MSEADRPHQGAHDGVYGCPCPFGNWPRAGHRRAAPAGGVRGRARPASPGQHRLPVGGAAGAGGGGDPRPAAPRTRRSRLFLPTLAHKPCIPAHGGGLRGAAFSRDFSPSATHDHRAVNFAITISRQPTQRRLAHEPCVIVQSRVVSRASVENPATIHLSSRPKDATAPIRRADREYLKSCGQFAAPQSGRLCYPYTVDLYDHHRTLSVVHCA